MWDFSILPEQASTFASEVDAFYFALVGVTAFFTVVIYAMIWFFAVRYRRGKKVNRANAPTSNHLLEAAWIIMPLGIVLAIFGWSSKIYFDIKIPPKETMKIHAIGKQWMWKFVNEAGRYEVNELHVPVGRPVEINMISVDVLHDLYFPTFRTKMDVVPGRYTSLWFEATKPGVYPIFCAEYCGLLHSGMIGKVYVMEPGEYDKWIAGGSSASFSAETAGNAQTDGQGLFTSLGCQTCHKAEGGALGPSLNGVYGHEQELADGSMVTVDDTYIRESVLNPTAQVAKGFNPVMPSFKGQVSEEQIVQLISYIKTLK